MKQAVCAAMAFALLSAGLVSALFLAGRHASDHFFGVQLEAGR